MAKSSLVGSPYIAQITDWSPGVSVNIGRPLVYGGQLYRVLVSHVTGPSFDPSKFEALTGIAEAPIDGQQYARKDGAWDTLTIDASKVSIDVTANTNGITLGNVVELVSTGGQNVQNIYHCEAPTIGSLVTLDGTNNISNLAMASVDSSNVIAIGRETSTSGALRTFLISAGNPPTSVMDIPSTNNASFCSIDDLSSTAFAFSYKVTGDGSGRTRLGFISGSDVTFSTESATLGAIADITTATCALTSSNWFVAYVDTNNDCQIRTAISNGASAPTLGTVLNVNGTNNTDLISLAKTSSITAMLVLRDTSSNNDGMIFHVTGGTTNAPTSSTEASLDGTNNCAYITQSPIDSNHTLCAYNNVTLSKGRLAVIQANGTNAPTVISRAETEASLDSYLTLTAHSSNLHSLTGIDSVTSDGKVLSIFIDSNYNITQSALATLQGTNNCAYTTIAALTPTTGIAAFQGTGSDGFAGTLTLTPTPVISGQLLGIAETSATNGATASVAIGPIVAGTYTSGADYYVSGAGGLTTNATPVHVLKAKSTTEGVLELRGAPEADKLQAWMFDGGQIDGAFSFTAPETAMYRIIMCGPGGNGTSGAEGHGGTAGCLFIYEKPVKAGTILSGAVYGGGSGATVFDGRTAFAGYSGVQGSYTDRIPGENCYGRGGAYGQTSRAGYGAGGGGNATNNGGHGLVRIELIRGS